jgi:hypothetical protein
LNNLKNVPGDTKERSNGTKERRTMGKQANVKQTRNHEGERMINESNKKGEEGRASRHTVLTPMQHYYSGDSWFLSDVGTHLRTPQLHI